MFVYRGGDKGGKGTYWDLINGSRVDLTAEGTLPQDRKTRFLRISSVIMLMLAPILGLIYIAFLPIASIAIVAMLVVKKVWGWLLGLTRKHAYFEWRPSEAYLAKEKKTGKKDLKKKDQNGKEDGRSG
ncbi:MAG: hypothetical protein AABY87_14095 [bacterium]